MKVPMLDLRAQYASIRKEIEEAVLQTLEKQQFRGGPIVESFEKNLAAFAEVKHAIGVGSGTDALYVALRGLGLNPGDEVITSPFSFFATAGAIVNAGGVPVFADIEADSFNMDPASIEPLITAKTRCLLPVHVFGQCARMDAIEAIAKRHNLPIIEDAAQALGARYQGKQAGAWGYASALSFYPTKNLGAAGEGGAILTNDDDAAQHLRLLRGHGMDCQCHHIEIGVNSHLHTLQAAVLDVKIKKLEEWNRQRRERASYYTSLLQQLPEIVAPTTIEDACHLYHQYVIRVPDRDRVQKELHEKGIGCSVFYPRPLHRQPCIERLLKAPAYCPKAEQACREVLALPIYPELTQTQQDAVIAALAELVPA